MSYCRWSSDNWKSDVYVYEGDVGYVIHVASRRRARSPIPTLPLRTLGRMVSWLGQEYDVIRQRFEYPSRHRAFVAKLLFWAWSLSHRLSLWHLGNIPLVKIGLPADGETFVLDCPLACWEKLVELRAMGYHVPYYALDQLLSEAAEW
jgi:hypothetical protein